MRFDNVDAATRSRMMAGIRSKNTKPELLVRSGLHRRGLRFKLHDRNLPGRPDLIFPRHRAVIFVHGCFWHGHDCSFFRWPRSRDEFWRQKITSNKNRDRSVIRQLEDAGWRVLTIWECAFRGRPVSECEALLDKAAEWIFEGVSGEALRGDPSGNRRSL